MSLKSACLLLSLKALSAIGTLISSFTFACLRQGAHLSLQTTVLPAATILLFLPSRGGKSVGDKKSKCMWAAAAVFAAVSGYKSAILRLPEKCTCTVNKVHICRCKYGFAGSDKFTFAAESWNISWGQQKQMHVGYSCRFGSGMRLQKCNLEAANVSSLRRLTKVPLQAFLQQQTVKAWRSHNENCDCEISSRRRFSVSCC